MMSVSQIIMNSQMAHYGDMALAGAVVAMKETMMTGMVCIGLGQGIQPLLGYCVEVKKWDRHKEILQISLVFAFLLSTAVTGICYIFTEQIVRIFLTNHEALHFGVSFSRILLCTSFLFGIFFVLLNALQACGAAMESLIVNVSRQGLIYILALFILNAFFRENGLFWAQPIVDILSLILAIVLYSNNSKQLLHGMQQ